MTVHFIFAAQNQWLRQSVLDAHGNLLFCQERITAFTGVHTERLQRQCTIKQQMNQRPIVIMTKKEVTERRLENVVLCPDDGKMHTFEMWWKSLVKTRMLK